MKDKIYTIKLLDNTVFDCNADETIIQSALRNDVFLEHSCLSGKCSSCKFKILEGETETNTEELTLIADDRNNGFVLTCVRKPLTNLVIEAENLSQYGFTQAKTIPAKINEITKLTQDILSVKLRLPPTQNIEFIEGQYLNTIWKGVKRSYSIASASSSGTIDLIIKYYPNGTMSEYWFNEAKINDLLRLEIPKGTFFLRKNDNLENLIFVATGTGIAPIKSIIESAKNQDKFNQYQRIIVLWGMKYEHEIFWKPSSQQVEFIPVLSRENGAKDYVQYHLPKLDVDWTKTAIYACGSDIMIQEVNRKCIELGLITKNFYSDAFVVSN